MWRGVCNGELLMMSVLKIFTFCLVVDEKVTCSDFGDGYISPICIALVGS